MKPTLTEVLEPILEAIEIMKGECVREMLRLRSRGEIEDSTEIWKFVGKVDGLDQSARLLKSIGVASSHRVLTPIVDHGEVLK